MRFRRRRGQGISEYVVIVGLVAVGLVIAVVRFKESLRVAIEGSGEGVERVANRIEDAGSVAAGGSGPEAPGESGPAREPDDGE